RIPPTPSIPLSTSRLRCSPSSPLFPYTTLFRSSGGWPQYPTKYEIDTFGIVNTLLHTFNSTTFSEVTVGMNWAHQYTSPLDQAADRKSTRLNSSHVASSYAVFCLKKKKNEINQP